MRGQEDDEDPARPTFRLLREVWIHAVSRAVLSGAVFCGYVTIVGLIYNVVYFGPFNIEPFESYDTQDFLLAGLRIPILLALPPAMMLGGFLFGVAVLVVDRLDRRWRGALRGA